MGCELCGKEELLFKAIVEGTLMQVCKNCGKFGKIFAAPVSQQNKKAQQKTEQVFDVVDDFAQKIKKAREKTGKTQKEFSMELNEKESLIAKLETGTAKPSIQLAQKLEKLLGIKLVEEQMEGTVEKRQKTGVLTIGDIIKTK
ncbi:MAG: TIGR00270 family protein [Candidatus Aenigmarchaeota archaeon]|nr:TIGR00270 family protein [Candidatus Aenigmarchaeota archaeon]